MIRRLRITVLADNTAGSRTTLAEHGLSLLIEADDRRILFDTGQGRVLRANLASLNLALDPLDALVLSHGHYDHTGGVPEVLQSTMPEAIFVHPSALSEKFARREPPPFRSMGMPVPARDALLAAMERIVWTRTVTPVVPGVWCTGEIPRTHPAPDEESPFFLDARGHVPDLLHDDQALFIETDRGLVILAGCAHSGVVNTLDFVCRLADRDEVFALIGGFHLGRASQATLEAAGDALQGRKVRYLAPCHCTGMRAQAYLRARFGSLVHDVGTGSRVLFE